MVDKDLVKLINKLMKKLKLNIPCDFGFKKTKEHGIWVEMTRGALFTKHTPTQNIQITVKLGRVKNGYLSCQDIVNQIVEMLSKQPACMNIATQYAGEFENDTYYYITCKLL